MNTLQRYLIPLLAAVATAFLLVGLALVPVPMLYFYDDGVYYVAAVRVSSGDRPYTDFYLAHPPALIWATAGLVRVGADLVACRAASWVVAIGFVTALALFVRRVNGECRFAGPTGCLAAVFLAGTGLYLEAASQVLTQLPGMAVTLVGFFLLLPNSHRPAAAGVCLAVASLFRIQVAFIGPAWVAFIFATYGWATGRGPVVRLTLAAFLTAVLAHGGMELTHTRYLDCVIRSHTTRASTPIGEKIEILNSLFREPQVAFGLLAAAILSCGSRGPIRGLGVFTLTETLITLVGSRFLGDGYFLPVYPYLLGCGAILVGREAARLGSGRPFVVAALIVIVCAGVPIARKTIYRWTTQHQFEHDLIERVRVVPGHTVACTPGKIPVFAGKELVRDYHTPDTTSPVQHGFGPWFVELARRADVVVLTDQAVNRLSPADARAILTSGKAIVFGTEAEERDFRRLTSEGPP